MYVFFVLAVVGLSGAAGVAAWMRDARRHQAGYQQELDARRREHGALVLRTDEQRRTLHELKREVERPLLGDPDHTEIVNVTSLNQQAGITAGSVEWTLAEVRKQEHADQVRLAAPSIIYMGTDIDAQWRERYGLPDEPPERWIKLDGDVPWPDRHPKLYRRLPWSARRAIINHYLEEDLDA